MKQLIIGTRSVVWLKSFIKLSIIAIRSWINSSTGEQMSSSCWEENAAAKALWAPELQEKAQPVVPLFFIFLREALRLDSWEGCDSSHYSPAHISHLNWEGKWPSLPYSLDAVPGHRRTLTRSSELSSSLLSEPSLSSVTTHTYRLMLLPGLFFFFFCDEYERRLTFCSFSHHRCLFIEFKFIL